MKQQQLLIGGLLAACCISAYATDTTAVMSATTSINTTCSVSTQNMEFSTFYPNMGIGTPVGSPSHPNGQTTADVDVTCTDLTPYSVYISAGGSGNVTTREMTGQTFSEVLTYQIYTDSGYNTIWGDGTVGTDYNCGDGTGSTQTYTAYGQIDAGQAGAHVDSYSDTVSVDVSY